MSFVANVEERKECIVNFIAQHGQATRQELMQALHLSEGPISQLVGQCLAEGKLVDVKCKHLGWGVGRKQNVLMLPEKVEPKNPFKGWGGAPTLGLAGWSEAPVQRSIIHLTSY